LIGEIDRNRFYFHHSAPIGTSLLPTDNDDPFPFPVALPLQNPDKHLQFTGPRFTRPVATGPSPYYDGVKFRYDVLIAV
jgi:hypothetical protein